MLRASIIATILLSIALPCSAGQFENLAAGILAMYRTSPAPQPSPQPTPTPTPSGVCDNCGGTGKLGDGTVSVTCPVCDGTGRKKLSGDSAHGGAARLAPSPTAQPAKRLGYPVRGNWWTGCPSWHHLTTGEHAGQFDPAWLQTLSNAEIQSLHSDSHEGKTRWQYVKRPAAHRVGGRYEWRCDGRSCGWFWIPQ